MIGGQHEDVSERQIPECPPPVDSGSPVAARCVHLGGGEACGESTISSGTSVSALDGTDIIDPSASGPPPIGPLHQARSGTLLLEEGAPLELVSRLAKHVHQATNNFAITTLGYGASDAAIAIALRTQEVTKLL